MTHARILAFALALGAASPVSAMTAADLANGAMFVRAPIDRVAAAQRTELATKAYFATDTLVSLGAFAVAGGAFAALIALGARRKADADCAENEEPAWRDSVFAAIQQDLTRYTDGLNRHAA